MNEIEEFFRNQALIDSIKNTLISYGYEYNNRIGWYCECENRLDEEKKRVAKIGIEKFKAAAARNDELKKKFNIPC